MKSDRIILIPAAVYPQLFSIVRVLKFISNPCSIDTPLPEKLVLFRTRLLVNLKFLTVIMYSPPLLFLEILLIILSFSNKISSLYSICIPPPWFYEELSVISTSIILTFLDLAINIPPIFLKAWFSFTYPQEIIPLVTPVILAPDIKDSATFSLISKSFNSKYYILSISIAPELNPVLLINLF